MGLLLVELIWFLSSMPVSADMNGNKTLPWPDGANFDFASKDSVQKERSKRNAGSKIVLFVPICIYLKIKLNYINI